jgi:hypothetical protein
MTEQVRRLNQYQTTEFDTEYVNASLFRLVDKRIRDNATGTKHSNLLDVGGGNGRYCDRFLNSYPNWQCTLVEPELSLLNKNTPHPNKRLINNTYQMLNDRSSFNAIQFNWVLHHFVCDTYRKSCAAQESALEKARELLTPGGQIFIFENFYEGTGFVELPCKIIYQITSSRALQNIAARMGANTAGVGVCFHSESHWTKLLEKLGFVDIQVDHCYEFGNLSPLKKAALCLNHQRVGFISARKPEY